MVYSSLIYTPLTFGKAKTDEKFEKKPQSLIFQSQVPLNQLIGNLAVIEFVSIEGDFYFSDKR
jgi:hypothetical protein